MGENSGASGAPRRVWAVVVLSVGLAAAVAAIVAPHLEPAPVTDVRPPAAIADRPKRTAGGALTTRPRARSRSEEAPPPAQSPAPASEQPSPEKIREEAKAFADAPATTPQQGLAKYAEAEDAVRKALVDAKQANKPEEAAAHTDTYKALLRESDEYAKRVITPAFVEKIPWKDLLDADMAPKWSKTTTIPGFACRIENGVLTVDPPDEGTKMLGVAAVLDPKTENLRHFVLDMEFEVDGVATMYFHISPPPQNPDNRQSETFELDSRRGALKPNERTWLLARMVGSDFEIRFPQNYDLQPYDDTQGWHKLRRGGIGFLIPEGTRLRVTRMRIRDLR